MFCTQCGTQIDQGKNFCKNCGARVGGSAPAAPEAESVRAPAAATMDPARGAQEVEPTFRRSQPMSIPASGGSAGNNKLIIAAAGVGFIVLAAGAVYFGTDLLKPAANQPSPRMAEPSAKATELPPLPSFEETKDPSPAGDSGKPMDVSQSPEPPPAAVEPPTPAPETKSMPKGNLPPPVKSQFQRAGQEASTAGRMNRPTGPTPASRGGANPGIYETLRTATVYEDPSASSRVVARIPAGTRVNVVSSSGEWLEVHSKRGNPPGFIRRGDASFVESSN